jgi:hypothetical protein
VTVCKGRGKGGKEKKKIQKRERERENRREAILLNLKAGSVLGVDA